VGATSAELGSGVANQAAEGGVGVDDARIIVEQGDADGCVLEDGAKSGF
jgi:hypothetical protein